MGMGHHRNLAKPRWSPPTDVSLKWGETGENVAKKEEAHFAHKVPNNRAFLGCRRPEGGPCRQIAEEGKGKGQGHRWEGDAECSVPLLPWASGQHCEVVASFENVERRAALAR